ncbi:ATP-binding protein [Streptomyces olivaceoviridis]
MTTIRKAPTPHGRRPNRDHRSPAGSPSEHAAVRGFEVDFLPADSLVREMRRLTADHLNRWDLMALSDTATLAVSELVTNAVRHGRGAPIGLRIFSDDQELRIEVRDGNPQPAQLRAVGTEAESGRGLVLVAALAKEWGVSPDGRTTWCSLAVPSGGR